MSNNFTYVGEHSTNPPDIGDDCISITPYTIYTSENIQGTIATTTDISDINSPLTNNYYTRAQVESLVSPLSSAVATVSSTQYFPFTLFSGTGRKFYRVGTLQLPQNGHHAIIQISLCFGYNFNPQNLTNVAQWLLQNYQLTFNLYSSNGFLINGSLVGSSRAIDAGSAGTDSSIYNSGGIFQKG